MYIVIRKTIILRITSTIVRERTIKRKLEKRVPVKFA